MDVSGLTGDIAAARITNALNASGSAPIYAARAWVNFDGTGTVAIRESGNVSSITDNGTGDYTVNFTTAMPDANFAVAWVSNAAQNLDNSSNRAKTTTSASVLSRNSSNTNSDAVHSNVAIFR
jgi:hypothetical protein